MTTNPNHNDLPALTPMPALYCPIPPYSHPRAAEIDKAACDWMRSCVLCGNPDTRQRLLQSGCSRLVSNSSPCGSIERLEAGGKWMYLGFVYDDWLESRATLDEIVAACCGLQRAQEVPESGLANVPFLPEFLHVMGELRRFATPTQYARFTNERRKYFQALPWEASYRFTGKTPDLNTYVTLRLGAASTTSFLTAMEIFNEDEVPSSEIDHPAVQAVREVAASLLGWTNDLYSLSKDARDGTGENNLVTCIQQERHVSIEEARAEAITMFNRSMLLFVQLRDQLNPHGSPPLKKFLGDCGRAIAGAVAWHAGIPRYATQALPITADRPAGLDSFPLDIPSIAWWWQQLE
ncbi:terpene synthase family protein [Streptomyces griseus]|uniref:terpene synthase family protein n=1 Tax=Streptomyces griseus TaxID=1911 RepID=UPI001112E68B|nr:terpene synthase family protein [Streptomyces griseus]